MRNTVPLTLSLISALLGACHSPTRAKPEPAAALLMAAAPPTTTSAPAPPPRSPEALATLLAEYDRRVAAGVNADAIAETREAITQMAAQRDAHVSRLFWYTDLDQAKAAAQATGRPILSLRLLGRLDDELSCANSRLFRMTLYSDKHVSGFLRDTYVLHWASERPAPQITVDYGDGRVVKRTITGNSAHYVLDSHGRVVDALPGLYGPAAFEKSLRRSLDVAKKSGDLSDDESRKAVAKHQTHELWALTAEWRNLLTRSYGEQYDLKNANLPKPVGVYWPDPVYASLPAAARQVRKAADSPTISKSSTAESRRKRRGSAPATVEACSESSR